MSFDPDPMPRPESVRRSSSLESVPVAIPVDDSVPWSAAIALRLVLPAVILAFGVGAYAWLARPPEATVQPPAPPKPVRTRVTELRAEDYVTTIRTRGVVRPHHDVPLTSQVAGRVIAIARSFEVGAFFEEGEVLLELDPVDFQVAVLAAEAQLARADAAHSQEETRSRQAERNWKDLGYEDEPSELVLRIPQLREAKANVDSAQAQLERARRDFERTKVRAPFAGRVRDRIVGLGQVVGGGTALGTVFATDYAEVRLPIAGRDLEFVELPESHDEPPVEVVLRDALASDADETWTASILRTEGVLDASSLEVFAVARVDDPFGLASGREPLRIGQPVTAEIAGQTLEGVIVVPRSSVRQLDRVFLVHPDSLTLTSLRIEPIWSDRDHVVVAPGVIQDGMLLSTMPLVHAPEGARVEILPASDGDGAPEGVGESRSLEGKGDS